MGRVRKEGGREGGKGREGGRLRDERNLLRRGELLLELIYSHDPPSFPPSPLPSLSPSLLPSLSPQLFASGGGGCCDCGDPEAWTSDVYCEIHKPTEETEDEVCTTFLFRHLSIQQCLSSFFGIIFLYLILHLRYIVSLLKLFTY